MSTKAEKVEKQKPDYIKIAERFFESHKLTDHQIKSYDEFMRFKLSKIIEENPQEYTKGDEKHRLQFQNIYVAKPEIIDPNGVRRDLYPSECRDRMMSYSGDVYVDIIHEIVNSSDKTKKSDTYKEINIGKIPIMLGSGWCHLTGLNQEQMIQQKECINDPGGYFVSSGKEYALLSQDRMAHNEIFVFESGSKQNKTTTRNGNKKTREYSHHAIVRSYNENSEPNISTTQAMITCEDIDRGEESLIYFNIPGFKEEIPLVVIFLAFNVKLEDIERYILGDVSEDDKTDKEKENMKMLRKLLKPSLTDTVLSKKIVKDQESAIVFLSTLVTTQRDKKIDSVHYFLSYKFLQNIEDMKIKLHNFSHMVYLLLSTAAGIRPADDRDHYARKRVETAGSLFNNLIRSIWKNVSREVKGLLEKKKNLTVQTVYDNKLTSVVKKALETGNWYAVKTKNAKTGVSDNLNRHNYISTLSNIRRVITPSEKNSRVVKPRHLHPSQFGFICPFETPEGHKTGLQKNLCLSSTITLGSEQEIIIDYIKRRGSIMLEDYDVYTNSNNLKISVNGQWIAVGDIFKLEHELKNLRRENKIPREVSISIVNHELRIYTDEGRLISPFIILNDLKIPIVKDENWIDLVNNGIVEYLDVAELESLYISAVPWDIKENMTHSFIHPAMLAGVSAISCPFFNCNQSPRVIYQSSMCKQGLGVPALNITQRNDTTSHRLVSPHCPLIESRINSMFGSDGLPTGQNLVVAIASYTGMNQEDSLLYCKDSIDMGMMRSICYNSYIESNHKKGTVSTEIKMPEKLSVRETRQTGYSKIDKDGIPKENTPLQKRDIIVGKVLYTSEIVKDSSVVIKLNGMDDDSVYPVDTVSSENNINDEMIMPELTAKSERETLVVKPVGTSFVDRVLLTTDDDSNRTAIVRTRQTRIPQVGDKLACFKENVAEVLTIDGWKPIEKITLDDKVAVLKNNRRVFEHCLNIHCYAYSGDIYELRSKYVDLSVTPEHRMWVSDNFVDFKLLAVENIYNDRSWSYLSYDENINNNIVLTNNDNIIEKWESYTGNVYCLSVSTEVFLVRQNGKIVWSGNSRSAQKGIMGLGLSREDMPQCIKTGITPNIVMNPTGFPSRMTISQPKEALKSLLCCIKGFRADGTAYENSRNDLDDIDCQDVYKIEKELEKELETYGLSKWGDTQMISGITGEIMNAKIYMAPTYYQRLRHMVDDKIHARSQNGPRDILSMQPIDGRRRGGGFRVGEMECWSGISHGASNFLIDRLVNNSDAYEHYICDDCGNAAVADVENKIFNCRRCDQNTRISRVKIPHSFKLMQQELMATGIGVWLEV